MYDLNDTIVAVSSPSSGTRAIVRLTGPATIKICERIFRLAISSFINRPSSLVPRLTVGRVVIDDELEIDAHLYLFFAPRSYTGEDVAEIHIYASDPVTEFLVNNILKTQKSVGQAPPYDSPITNHYIRMAGPGEFTARAYLNGKLDLAQAEAVNEIVVSSNTFQLAAAEKLLSGHLGQATEKVRSAMMDCLSLIEAGLDFSEETIEFITRQEMVERLTKIKGQLEQLLSAGLSYESVIDLPAVGIGGAANAGKSSLLNKLLGAERSIVSDQSKTTRDVLSGLLTLAHCKCVLFDCAGLTRNSEDRRQKSEDGRQKLCPPFSVLDELAQQAATSALRNSSVVIFCVDISKDSRLKTQDSSRKSQDLGLFDEEIGLWSWVCGLGSAVVPVATKCDLVSESVLAKRLRKLSELFSAEFLQISVKTGAGLQCLRDTIDRRIISLMTGLAGQELRFEFALTARHRKAASEAQANIIGSLNEYKAGNDEVAAMMLRAAYHCICDIEQQHIDEQILEQIFSRFCIGK